MTPPSNAVANWGHDSIVADLSQKLNGMKYWSIHVLDMVSQRNLITAPVIIPRSGLFLSNWTPEIRRIFPIIIAGSTGRSAVGSSPVVMAMPLGRNARAMASHGPRVRVVAISMAFIIGPVIHCWWLMSTVIMLSKANPLRMISLLLA